MRELCEQLVRTHTEEEFEALFQEGLTANRLWFEKTEPALPVPTIEELVPWDVNPNDTPPGAFTRDALGPGVEATDSAQASNANEISDSEDARATPMVNGKAKQLTDMLASLQKDEWKDSRMERMSLDLKHNHLSPDANPSADFGVDGDGGAYGAAVEREISNLSLSSAAALAADMAAEHSGTLGMETGMDAAADTTAAQVDELDGELLRLRAMANEKKADERRWANMLQEAHTEYLERDRVKLGAYRLWGIIRAQYGAAHAQKLSEQFGRPFSRRELAGVLTDLDADGIWPPLQWVERWIQRTGRRAIRPEPPPLAFITDWLARRNGLDRPAVYLPMPSAKSALTGSRQADKLVLTSQKQWEHALRDAYADETRENGMPPGAHRLLACMRQTFGAQLAARYPRDPRDANFHPWNNDATQKGARVPLHTIALGRRPWHNAYHHVPVVAGYRPSKLCTSTAYGNPYGAAGL
jgi:hypothetical protein